MVPHCARVNYNEDLGQHGWGRQWNTGEGLDGGRIGRGPWRRLLARVPADGGFGLVELLAAMAVTMIAVTALVAALTSSHVALVRAARITTSNAVASAQLERFRAVKYGEIRLDTTSVAAADATYTGDPGYETTAAHRVTAACGSPVPDICLPTRTVTGADGRTYRLDTFIAFETPASGRQVKRITVVVRDGSKVRVRQTSAFDEASAS